MKITNFTIVAVMGLILAACGDNGDPSNSAHIHDYSEWEVTKAATCKEKGTKERVCKLDATHTETGTIPIDPAAHDWEEWSVKAIGVVTRICSLNTSHIDTKSISEYIATEDGTVDNPVMLSMQIDYGNIGADSIWQNLLTAIETAEKYIAIDLSECTGMGTFDPGTANTGEKMIVSLVLPNTATSIVSGRGWIGGDEQYEGSFKNFTALKSISGTGITSIGNYAFCNCDELESVDLPAMQSIGDGAFINCTVLKNVNLPVLKSIGDDVFMGCTALKNISFSNVESIGGWAFYKCTALEKNISIPIVESIGDDVFRDCAQLESISLPLVQNIGNRAFIGCTSLESITLGTNAPSLGSNILDIAAMGNRIFTVKIPEGATGYDDNWQENFKNLNITLSIVEV